MIGKVQLYTDQPLEVFILSPLSPFLVHWKVKQPIYLYLTNFRNNLIHPKLQTTYYISDQIRCIYWIVDYAPDDKYNELF